MGVHILHSSLSTRRLLDSTNSSGGVGAANASAPLPQRLASALTSVLHEVHGVLREAISIAITELHVIVRVDGDCSHYLPRLKLALQAVADSEGFAELPIESEPNCTVNVVAAPSPPPPSPQPPSPAIPGVGAVIETSSSALTTSSDYMSQTPHESLLLASFFTALALPAALVFWLYQGKLQQAKQYKPPWSAEEDQSNLLKLKGGEMDALPSSEQPPPAEEATLGREAARLRRWSSPDALLYSVNEKDGTDVLADQEAETATPSPEHTVAPSSAEDPGTRVLAQAAEGATLASSDSASCLYTDPETWIALNPSSSTSCLHTSTDISVNPVVSRARAHKVVARARARAAREAVSSRTDRAVMSQQQDWLAQTMRIAREREEAPRALQSEWLETMMAGIELDLPWQIKCSDPLSTLKSKASAGVTSWAATACSSDPLIDEGSRKVGCISSAEGSRPKEKTPLDESLEETRRRSAEAQLAIISSDLVCSSSPAGCTTLSPGRGDAASEQGSRTKIKRHDGLVQLHFAILEGGADPADGPEKGFTRGERGSDERASEGRMAAEAGGRMHATTGQRCNGACASAGEAAALSFGDRRGDSANDVSEQQTGRISYEEKLKLGKKLPVELRRSQSSVGKARGAHGDVVSVQQRLRRMQSSVDCVQGAHGDTEGQLAQPTEDGPRVSRQLSVRERAAQLNAQMEAE